MQDTIESFSLSKTHFVAHKDSYNEADENPWSHDNHTGMVTLSYLYDLPYHKRLNYDYWIYRTQPWNLAYYATLAYPILGLLLKPIIAIKHVSGVIDFTENDKTETGGKILGFVHLNILGMNLTKKLCEYILKKNTMFGSYQEVFDYYFKCEDHPNRVLFRK